MQENSASSVTYVSVSGDNSKAHNRTDYDDWKSIASGNCLVNMKK